MSALLRGVFSILPLGIWAVLWIVGGYWMVRSAFNLRPNEQALVGFTVGLVIENLFANMLGQILPIPLAFWLAAVLVFGIGMWMRITAGWRSLFQVYIQPGQWVVFLVLFGLFTAIGRGLALFDDYAHLPTASLIATGQIPPHFALDPNIPYNYHYFLLLFAAQFMRIGDLFVWMAVDITRALAFALGILLAAVWTQRLTHSRLAGFLGAVMAMFGMGSRWLLFLLPADTLENIAQGMTMIGSGKSSGANFAAAMLGSWGIDGMGPLPFPFAFVNGIFQPGVMSVLSVNSLITTAIAFSLLLSFNRWRGWKGWLVTTLLIASLSLLTEIGIVLTLGSWGLVSLAWAIQHKSIKLPRTLWLWWAALIAGNLIGLLQGGALSGIVSDTLAAQSGAAVESYQTVGFQMGWTPVIVSSHLGVLSLLNLGQLLVALAEIGPILVVLPLVVIWGFKAYRAGRWYEAAMVVSALVTLMMVLVQFTGSTGVRNTSRLYDFIGVCATFAVPLVWRWAARRSDMIKSAAAALGFIVILGGMVLFANELSAIQKPVYSTFIGDLDAKMTSKYWNQLEPGMLIFDYDVFRAPTLFGRYTDSSVTWFAAKPEWQKLNAAPDPYALRAAGYGYVYLDQDSYAGLPLEYKEKFKDPCVTVMDNFEDWTQASRTLLDIRGCQR